MCVRESKRKRHCVQASVCQWVSSTTTLHIVFSDSSITESRAHQLAKLASQQVLRICLSLTSIPLSEGLKKCTAMPGFTWVLGIQTEALVHSEKTILLTGPPILTTYWASLNATICWEMLNNQLWRKSPWFIVFEYQGCILPPLISQTTNNSFAWEIQDLKVTGFNNNKICKGRKV